MLDNLAAKFNGSYGMVLFLGFFFVVGLIIFISSFKMESKLKSFKPFFATITRIECEGRRDDKFYYTYVDYKYNGIEYKDKNLGYYSPSFHEGDEIEILINPDNPDEITYKSSVTLLRIIGIGFILFTCVVLLLVS